MPRLLFALFSVLGDFLTVAGVPGLTLLPSVVIPRTASVAHALFHRFVVDRAYNLFLLFGSCFFSLSGYQVSDFLNVFDKLLDVVASDNILFFASAYHD